VLPRRVEVTVVIMVVAKTVDVYGAARTVTLVVTGTSVSGGFGDIVQTKD
jgi:hypothetical protein